MLEQLTLAYYEKGYNCAEAMIRGADEAYGLRIGHDDIKLFSGYGLGMGCMGTCGLATVGLAVYSRLAVGARAHDTEGFVQACHRYMDGFAAQVGSTGCAQLRQMRYDRTAKCRQSVVLACRYTEEFLVQAGLVKSE